MVNSDSSLNKFIVSVAIYFAMSINIAYGDFSVFANFGSKWGDPVHGTVSDTITWSFMSDLTTLAASHPLLSEVVGGASAGSSISTLQSSFDTANGSGSFVNAFQNAFNTWSSASGGRVMFQFVADNGAIAGDSNNPASSAVDIRIGAFHSVANSGFAGIGAVGYGPPGNDLNMFFRDALAGDVILNLDSQFFRAPGNEGDIFYNGGAYVNDLEGLVLHELGHAAIGLGHSFNGVFPGQGDVMYVDNFPTSVNFINRQPSAQDIAGLQSVYGITAVPEPSSLVFAFCLAVAGTTFRFCRHPGKRFANCTSNEPKDNRRRA
ncbi:MAG: hypothetical protein ABL921_01715 [Pirellula sp.]